ncbi:MAG: glycosyltransferase family 39 protein [Bacteroidales bacterium]
MKRPYKTYVFLLMGLSLLLRALAVVFTDLGNDEVYYWTYALYPDWSHFDHPPMVGWIISLFTCNLAFDHPFVLRLPALVLGTLNTWLIWRLSLLIGNEKTGWYAALLYTGSLYATVLCGTFILPDTPLAAFYLASLYFMLRACGCTNDAKEKPSSFLWAGLFAGGAMLSKYTGAYLWPGTLL